MLDFLQQEKNISKIEEKRIKNVIEIGCAFQKLERKILRKTYKKEDTQELKNKMVMALNMNCEEVTTCFRKN